MEFQNVYYYAPEASLFSLTPGVPTQQTFFQNDQTILQLLVKEDELQPTQRSRSLKRETRPRTKYTTDQIQILEAAYHENKYIRLDRRKQISEAANLTQQQVTNWFHNRRARERKKLKQDQELEEKWNRYLMDLVRNVDIAPFYHLVQDMNGDVLAKRGSAAECPHEYFHQTNLKCPCAAN